MMNVGSVRLSGQPKSNTVSEVLSLMQLAGGGDKNVRKLLEEMREVQAHNEQVMKEAMLARKEAIKEQEKVLKAVSEADQARAGAVQAQEDLKQRIQATSRVFDNRSKSLEKSEADLKRRKAEFEARMRDELKVIDNIKNDLTKRTVAVEKRETECKSRLDSLNRILQNFIGIESQLSKAISEAKRVV